MTLFLTSHLFWACVLVVLFVFLWVEVGTNRRDRRSLRDHQESLARWERRKRQLREEMETTL